MNRLYILYDGECALCQRCRRWLAQQPAFLELRFIAFQSPEVGLRFPGIESLNPGHQLLVVSDEGAVYQGPQAWIMCLYALREYREWSERLAHPAVLPFARRACELISQNRLSISRLFAKGSEEALAKKLATTLPPRCDTQGRCNVSEIENV